MLEARRTVVRRWIALVVVTMLMAVPAAAGAAPARVAQEDPSEGEDEAATDRELIDVDETLAQEDPAAILTALTTGAADIEQQLEALNTAEAEVTTAVANLADADAAIESTTLEIEELTGQSDAVVIDAFISPPAENAWDVFAAEDITDATVKQALLDMRADESANVLDELAEKRELLESQREDQRVVREEYAEAKSAADTALDDLESAVDQHTEFVMAVEARLAEPSDEQLTPEQQAAAAARSQEITGTIAAIKQQEAIEEAQRLAEEERKRQEEENRLRNAIFCPVDGGGLHFTDTWGAARSGGRTHQGTDMLADSGTPTVAPVSGRIEHRSVSIGGRSWYVYGDNGHTYFGTHLSGYEQTGAGHVAAGTVIGYVGDDGNAAGTPHLHFEWKPNGGSSVNPYEILDAACPSH